MKTPTEAFQSLCDNLCKIEGVEAGKMMSSDGLKYRGKVILFFWSDTLVLKLGRDYDLEAFGITERQYLSPFKQKPPMYDWLMISAAYQDQWPTLANEALRIAGGAPMV